MSSSFWIQRSGPGLLACCSLLAIGNQAFAQDNDAENLEFEEIVITGSGSRLPADVTSVPGSVTLISADDLKLQSAISSDLGQMLANTIPGMGPSAKDGNNFSQTIRGRKPAFFIDGLPQSAALRGGGRDLRIVNPNVIERVEVIRGSTSIYGLGGSGGIVNYITKRPTNEGVEFFSEVGFSAALSNLESDGFEYTAAQGVSGKSGNIDFVGNVSYVSRGLYYDADGDLIPPDPTGQTGLADSDEWSFLGKIGIDFSDNVRLEVMATHQDFQVDTDYTTAQGDWSQGIKSVGELKQDNNFSLYGGLLTFDFIGEEDPSSHNTLLRSSLIIDNIFASSSLEAQIFYQDTGYTWRHLDFLPIAPTLGGYPPEGSQLQTDSSKRGGRIDIQTPIETGGLNGSLLWGMDYTIDRTGESLVDGRVYTSTLEQKSFAIFAQAQVDITDQLHVRGGIRYDDFKLDIPDFQALDHFDPTLTHSVIGTNLKYDSITGNVGLVYDLTDELNVFASWSRGFSIGDVLRSLRGLSPQSQGPSQTIEVAGLGLLIEPVSVDSYEAGLRYNGERIEGSVTGFYSSSDLGASFDAVTLETIRAPERIWGLEIALKAKITDGFSLGTSTAIQDSKTDSNNDGDWDGPLDFSRVPPIRLLTFAEWQFAEGWNARLQADTLFDESRFTAPFGAFERDVEGYTLFDLFVSGPFMGGKISLGVENLFNKQYFPLATYMNCQDDPIFYSFCATAAPGARGTIRFSINY